MLIIKHKKLRLKSKLKNRLLRRRADALCAEGYEVYYPPKELCGDNGAMVGAQAYYEYLAGNTAGMELNAAATMSIE